MNKRRICFVPSREKAELFRLSICFGRGKPKWFRLPICFFLGRETAKLSRLPICFVPGREKAKCFRHALAFSRAGKKQNGSDFQFAFSRPGKKQNVSDFQLASQISNCFLQPHLTYLHLMRASAAGVSSACFQQEEWSGARFGPVVFRVRNANLSPCLRSFPRQRIFQGSGKSNRKSISLPI